MTDIVAQMLELEADLTRKLDAVRQFLDTFAGARDSAVAGAAKGAPRAVVRREDGKRKTPAEKMDKFGSYGQAVIDASLEILPGENEKPMPTRELVAKLDFRNVEVRGENKVNALSALLARSSKIKGHGRSGWTIHGERSASAAYDPEIEALLGSAQAPNEEEPRSASAGGSFTDHNPVRTGAVVTGSTPSWPSITS